MKLNLPANYDADHPERYILLIGIHPEAFSFSVHDPHKEDSYFYQVLEKAPQEDALSSFKEYFFENDFFGQAFQEIYLVNYSSAFTYVPSLLYDENDKEKVMYALFSEKKKERILEQSLEKPGITLLHKIDEEVYEFLHRSFVDALFVHYSSEIIHYFLDRAKLDTKARIVLNFRGKELDVYAFRDDNFILGNHYEYREMNDALYYALLTWKQLKMDQVEDSLYITGDETSVKEAGEKLGYYIQHVIPFKLPPLSL